MSYTSLTYHIVIGTYRRKQVIGMRHERELYAFITSFSTSRGVKIRRVGGMPDHVHILCDIPATMALAEYVKVLKAETSKFLRVNPDFPNWEKWAEGYAAFTVDADSRETRRQYIINQKEHHCKVSFDEEFRQILAAHGLTPV